MIKVRRRIFYKIGALAFLAIVGIALFNRQPPDISNTVKIMHIERSIRSVMNQGECRHPNLPIDNPEIMQFYTQTEKLNCGNPLEDWVMCEKSICFVKPEVVATFGEVVCSYTDILRKSDYSSKYGKTTRTKEPYVLQASDFVKVVCKSEHGQSWFGMAYGIRDTVRRHIPVSNSLPIGIPPNIVADTNSEEVPAYFNVLIYGFDSLSRNAFMRKLPKTFAFLTQLNAVVLKGYNIVGDGTPQALVPILTGYTELELPETRKQKPNSMSVAVYPFIWKKFAEQGYVTSFNEDLPQVGTFTYRMKGFNDQPVDHYLRTYYVEVSNILSSSKPHCISKQPDHLVMLDYTKNFMTKYKESPRFVFSFHGGLSHDSINMIGVADDDVLEWLTSLKSKQILDNTILVVMSDHGNRFSDVRGTLQGKQEERLPFFSFTFPEAFKKRFPTQYANFVNNSDALTTPFDVHATLQQILKMQEANVQVSRDNVSNDDDTSGGSLSAEETTPATAINITPLARDRAISLFEVIPRNRSCAEAYIEPHWCACLQWLPLEVDNEANTDILIKMAGSIVDAINNATNDFRAYCAPLELQKINWAMRLRPHKEMLQFKASGDADGYVADLTDKMNLHEEMYQMQIMLTPGESLFEATVTHDLRTFKAYTKLTEISRINKYGSQANCIYDRNPELRKYCYCRT